jgi:hypothetical protein
MYLNSIGASGEVTVGGVVEGVDGAGGLVPSPPPPHPTKDTNSSPVSSLACFIRPPLGGEDSGNPPEFVTAITPMFVRDRLNRPKVIRGTAQSRTVIDRDQGTTGSRWNDPQRGFQTSGSPPSGEGFD